MNGCDNQMYEAPLLVAARCGRSKCVDLLIRAGADVTCTDAEEQTPLSLAAYYRVNGYGYEGEEPSVRDRVSCMKSLLREGARANARNERNWHNAIEYLIANASGWEAAETVKKRALLLFAAGEKLADRVQRKICGGGLKCF